MKPGLAPILAAGLLLAPLPSPAPESAPQAPPGIRSVRLVTDASAVVPGRPLTVGLLLDPEPGHHTYWRGPGIVGVATRLDWNLPPGFAAGPILWPPPETVLMAGIVIVVEALSYIRGRSIAHQFMIVDEAQNLTPLEAKTILTRVGHGTKIILTGDPYQIDNPYVDASSNGFNYVVSRFRDQGLAAQVELAQGERSELAELAANIL